MALIQATIKREIRTYDSATDSFLIVDASVANVTVSTQLGFRRRDIDGETIQEGDFHLLVASKDIEAITPGFVPSHQTDTLLKGTEEFEIIRVKSIHGANEVAMYDIHCRG